MDLAEFSDSQLVLLFAHGTRAAFDELFRRHRQTVYRVAVRMVGERADAEEILQEVFLRLARSASTWEPRARLSTWLYRVTVNRCLTHRERQSKSKLVLLPGVEAVATEEHGPVQEVLRRDLARRLRKRVSELAAPLASAFTLVALEGRSTQEAAEILEKPPGTVKTHVHRARLLLRRSLASELAPTTIQERSAS